VGRFLGRGRALQRRQPLGGPRHWRRLLLHNSALTSGSYLAAGGSSWNSITGRATRQNLSRSTAGHPRYAGLAAGAEYNLKSQDDSIPPRRAGGSGLCRLRLWRVGHGDQHGGRRRVAIAAIQRCTPRTRPPGGERRPGSPRHRPGARGSNVRLLLPGERRTAQSGTRLSIPWLLPVGWWLPAARWQPEARAGRWAVRHATTRARRPGRAAPTGGAGRVPLLLAAAPALAQSGGDYQVARSGYDLSWSTIDGGGGTFSTGGSYTLARRRASPTPACWRAATIPWSRLLGRRRAGCRRSTGSTCRWCYATSNYAAAAQCSVDGPGLFQARATRQARVVGTRHGPRCTGSP